MNMPEWLDTGDDNDTPVTILAGEDQHDTGAQLTLGDLRKLFAAQQQLEQMSNYAGFLRSCAKSGEPPETFEWFVEHFG